MVDVSDATFEAEVLVRSRQVPVVVDCWAAWCGPCRALGPILERVVEAAAGSVALAKVDVDQNPQIASAFGVQSIPAVFALRDGQVVDSFLGAQPEAFVRQFVERLAPSEADELVGAGDEASLRRALELEPGHERAVLALAQMLVDKGEREEALALLAKVPETADTRRIAALARLGEETDLLRGGGVEARLDALLSRVRADQEARQEFLDLLAAMGDDPRVPGYRQALARQLF